ERDGGRPPGGGRHPGRRPPRQRWTPRRALPRRGGPAAPGTGGPMSDGRTRSAVLRVLGTIAPEADLAGIDPGGDLREQIDLDSIDFMNFVIGLNGELGVTVPESDYPKLFTLDG